MKPESKRSLNSNNAPELKTPLLQEGKPASSLQASQNAVAPASQVMESGPTQAVETKARIYACICLEVAAKTKKEIASDYLLASCMGEFIFLLFGSIIGGSVAGPSPAVAAVGCLRGGLIGAAIPPVACCLFKSHDCYKLSKERVELQKHTIGMKRSPSELANIVAEYVGMEDKSYPTLT